MQTEPIRAHVKFYNHASVLKRNKVKIKPDQYKIRAGFENLCGMY